MSEFVIELVIFQTTEKESEKDFLILSEKLGSLLAESIPGCLKRMLTKDSIQNKWIEIIHWESMESAENAMQLLPEYSDFQKYCACIKEDSISMFHLEEKKI